ncbi:protein RTF2-like protein [Gossypium australe]|uniref:Protein RTF2-like protein n=1 Tax=Gossypium australe TaxID=47621 RepID=A0A5B6WXX1_9ROSI|nr:protein RTF2-like protein [Gossypium australe]
MKLQFFLRSPSHQTLTVTLESTQSLTLRQLKSSLLPNPQSFSSFYFTLNGKPLSDSTLFPNPQISDLSTLFLLPRVSGGGGDGGATGAESRDCYLKMYAVKKPDKVDPNEKRLGKWLNCALSNEPLREPCVIDKLGNIFNKEALVEALLGKKLPKEFRHVKGLKDMINVKLSMIPGKQSDAADGATFQCPITGLEFNGKCKFFALRNCGHVVSAKALKEVKSSACLVCHKEFVESDKMVINGSEEEVAALRERMEEEKSKIVKEKKKRGIDVVDGKKDCGKLEGNEKLENGKKSNNGGVKKFRATDVAPANATKEVYASIFTSSKKSDFKETFTYHVTPAKDAKEVSVSIFTLKKSVDQFWLVKGDLMMDELNVESLTASVLFSFITYSTENKVMLFVILMKSALKKAKARIPISAQKCRGK